MTRAQENRENEDVNRRQMLVRLKAEQEKALSVVNAVFNNVGAGARELLADTSKLGLLVGGITALAMGVYGARRVPFLPSRLSNLPFFSCVFYICTARTVRRQAILAVCSDLCVRKSCGLLALNRLARSARCLVNFKAHKQWVSRQALLADGCRVHQDGALFAPLLFIACVLITPRAPPQTHWCLPMPLSCREGAKLSARLLERYLGQPALVRETSKASLNPLSWSRRSAIASSGGLAPVVGLGAFSVLPAVGWALTRSSGRCASPRCRSTRYLHGA